MRCDRGAGTGTGLGSSGKGEEVLEARCGGQGVARLLGTLCKGDRGVCRGLTVGSLGGLTGEVSEPSDVGVVWLLLVAVEASVTGVAGRSLKGCTVVLVGVMRCVSSRHFCLSVLLSGCSVLSGRFCFSTTSVLTFCCRLSRSVGRALRVRVLVVSLAA